MKPSPESLREVGEYLHNSTRLFPSPRSKKAFEWLLVKAEEIIEHAAAWETDQLRVQALTSLAQEQVKLDDHEIDVFIQDYLFGLGVADTE